MKTLLSMIAVALMACVASNASAQCVGCGTIVSPTFSQPVYQNCAPMQYARTYTSNQACCGQAAPVQACCGQAAPVQSCCGQSRVRFGRRSNCRQPAYTYTSARRVSRRNTGCNTGCNACGTQAMYNAPVHNGCCGTTDGGMVIQSTVTPMTQGTVAPVEAVPAAAPAAATEAAIPPVPTPDDT
jgi:hypothetical protein